MPTFEVGDTVRVPFPYTDRSTRQRRPALVVATGLGERGELIWVAMITSAQNRPWPDDTPLGVARATGLPAPSIVRPCKLATLEASHADRLGAAPPKLVAEVLSTLRGYLGSA